MSTYFELIVKGHARDLVPYISGAGIAGVYFEEESGFRVHELRERIRHHGDVEHLVCTQEALAAVKVALSRAAPRFRFEIESERAVTRASFTFHVSTPSRKIAGEVKAHVASPPRDVRVGGFAPQETVDPSLKGTEIYSPVHDYHFEARGEVGGDIVGVINFRETLRAIDFVQCDPIDLHE